MRTPVRLNILLLALIALSPIALGHAANSTPSVYVPIAENTNALRITKYNIVHSPSTAALEVWGEVINIASETVYEPSVTGTLVNTRTTVFSLPYPLVYLSHIEPGVSASFHLSFGWSEPDMQLTFQTQVVVSDVLLVLCDTHLVQVASERPIHDASIVSSSITCTTTQTHYLFPIEAVAANPIALKRRYFTVVSQQLRTTPTQEIFGEVQNDTTSNLTACQANVTFYDQGGNVVYIDGRSIISPPGLRTAEGVLCGVRPGGRLAYSIPIPAAIAFDSYRVQSEGSANP